MGGQAGRRMPSHCCAADRVEPHMPTLAATASSNTNYSNASAAALLPHLSVQVQGPAGQQAQQQALKGAAVSLGIGGGEQQAVAGA